jgi:hypothetical protein
MSASSESCRSGTLVVGAPKPHPASINLADHLVQMPPTGGLHPPTAKVGGDQRAKLYHPAPDCLAADDNAALGHHLLDAANAESEAKIQPVRVADYAAGEEGADER